MPQIATGQNPSCVTCLAWQKYPNQANEGECHRNSPRPQPGALTSSPHHWPRTYAQGWCIEWIPLPANEGGAADGYKKG